MENNDLKYWHGLALCPVLGGQAIKKISKYVKGDIEKLFSDPEIIRPALDPKLFIALKNHLYSLDLDTEFFKLQKLDVKIINQHSSSYPQLLSEIPDNPAVLYFKGNLNVLKQPTLAVVGTRKATIYGKKTADKILSELSETEVVVISGLALGVDSLVHQAALQLSLPTVAVLPGGVDDRSIYPKNNFGLAKNILKNNGLLVSEQPPGAELSKRSFPIRNRIIAGLSKAVLVVEAPEKSGALITARLALDYNREVFSIPGDITAPNCFGTNRLIQLGAIPIISGDDIKKLLNLKSVPLHVKKHLDLSEQEKQIFSCLTHDPKHIDKICRESKLQTSLVSETLIKIELLGIAKNLGGNQYIRIN